MDDFPTWSRLPYMEGVHFSRGRCVDCGFLTRRRIDRQYPLTFDEVAFEDRTGPFHDFAHAIPSLPENATVEQFKTVDAELRRGMAEVRLLQDSAGHDAVLWCYVGAFDLNAEVEAQWQSMHQQDPPDIDTSSFYTRENATRAILVRDRKCPKWFPYTEGFSPKEHLEELHMLQLEKERQSLQLRLAELDRAGKADQKETLERIAQISADHKAVTDRLADIGDKTAQINTKTDAFTAKWTKIGVGIAVLAIIAVLVTWLFPDGGREIVHAILHFIGAA